MAKERKRRQLGGTDASMAKVFYIPQWDTFENSQSKRVVHRMTWVAMPTRHDGAGYRRVARHKRGCEILGAWMLIVQVAAKCPVRGVLANAQGPLTPEDLALMTDIPAKSFTLAFEVLVDKQIQWLAARAFSVDDAQSTLGEQSTTLGASRATDKPTRTDKDIQTYTDNATGPVSSNQVKPDRAGGSRRAPKRALTPNQVFRLEFLQSLAGAFNWSPAQMMRQKRAMGAVARQLEQFSPERRDELAEGLIQLAKEKQAAGLDKPEAAWQAEVKRWDLAALGTGENHD